ncbi:MAG: DUF4476 domain-containing protein [Spirochaetales bacterium]|nr:DUF4476 domain-containing protein [Spirochaetales bacterium]
MKKLIWILPVVIAGILSTTVLYNVSSRELSNPKEQIYGNLQFIEDMYIKNLDFKERRLAISKIDEIFALLNKMGAQPAAPTVMTDSPFYNLLKEMKTTRKYEEQLNVFHKYSRKYYFNAAQFNSLVNTITFSSDKISFIRNNISLISTKEELLQFMSIVDKHIQDDIFKRDHTTSLFDKRK